MKLATNISHICWTNQKVATQAVKDDPYEWNWRLFNIEIDLVKFAYWLRVAMNRVSYGRVAN